MRRSTDEWLIDPGGDGTGTIRAISREGAEDATLSSTAGGAARGTVGDAGVSRAATQCAHGAGPSLVEPECCR
jgi:hypothetical protein